MRNSDIAKYLGTIAITVIIGLSNLKTAQSLNINSNDEKIIKNVQLYNEAGENISHEPRNVVDVGELIKIFLEIKNNEIISNLYIGTNIYYGNNEQPDQITLYDGLMVGGIHEIEGNYQISESAYQNSAIVEIYAIKGNTLFSFLPHYADSEKRELKVKSFYVGDIEISEEDSKLEIRVKVLAARPYGQGGTEFISIPCLLYERDDKVPVERADGNTSVDRIGENEEEIEITYIADIENILSQSLPLKESHYFDFFMYVETTNTSLYLFDKYHKAFTIDPYYSNQRRK